VKGWALPPPQHRKRFTKDQIEFLTAIFNEGEMAPSLKKSGAQVEVMMKEAMKSNGRRRFMTDELLTEAQIKSYFSRMSRELRERRHGEVRARRHLTNDEYHIYPTEDDLDDDYDITQMDVLREEIELNHDTFFLEDDIEL